MGVRVDFTVFPAIDLRRGQVVRLAQGDLARQSTYSTDPAGMARRWLEAGAAWLHVVNLDGAFDHPDLANREALQSILNVCAQFGAQVQFGGGLRSLPAVEQVLEAGVSRAVLGTAAIENPELVVEALHKFGADRIALGLDAVGGLVRGRGWTQASELHAQDLAQHFGRVGLRTVIYTDILRDGLGTGINLIATQALAEASGLNVIASGGVHALQDVRQVRLAGLAGVIIGRALYEGQLTLEEALAC
jgi:phosphoribosylformimino-5-aminoimidazole carboxamide ribotide isomerase